MRYINEIQSWNNGSIIVGDAILIYVIHDNLMNSATFYYKIFNVESNETISQGNITLDGVDYENWGTNENINDSAYTIITQKLNLILK